jgi:hypothetical protein
MNQIGEGLARDRDRERDVQDLDMLQFALDQVEDLEDAKAAVSKAAETCGVEDWQRLYFFG